ncbi:unnamed protein product, partial [Prorocentrum cordatum]
ARAHAYTSHLRNVMEALAKQLATLDSGPASKRRAAGSAGADAQIRELAAATAKTAAGIDGEVRRLKGFLETTALVPEEHPHMSGLQQTGRDYDAESKTLKEAKDVESLQKMMPSHERAWVDQANQVVKDGSVPDAHKPLLKQSHATTSLRGVQMEVTRAIGGNPKTELKSGAPTRNPNARSVIAELVNMGEFQGRIE